MREDTHQMSKTTDSAGSRKARVGLIVLIVALAFVASYQLAAVANSGAGARTSRSVGVGKTQASGTGSLPCACCGGGGTGEKIEGSAAVAGDVQTITVDTSNGYNPNVIKLKAGVPAEITFKQASGCLGQVQSTDFGFYEDLTTGDKTIRIEADKLTPGEYGFSCGMQMSFGTIVVE